MSEPFLQYEKKAQFLWMIFYILSIPLFRSV